MPASNSCRLRRLRNAPTCRRPAQARAATTLEEEAAIQAKLQELERRQRKQRQEIFNQEDEVADKRDELIANLQKRLSRGHAVETLFTIRWAVV